MSDTLLLHWRTSDQAIANAVADETVILHLGSGTYFGLDPIGARLWSAIKDGAIPASLCDDLVAEYDIDQATLERDLRTLIDELAANDLILPA